ncbi:MAG: DUF502 domain-containing protein [Paracoccaceae bacterium]
MLARLRTSFLTGIVVIAPVALTLWLIWSVIGWFDGFVLPFVPDAYRPEQILNTFFGYDLNLNIRGVGVVVFLIFATLVGWLAKGLIGRSFIKYAENLVNRMPVVRSFYSGIKQIAETVFAQQERSFEKACMIEYPRKGIWAIGFISTTAKGEIAERNSSAGPMVSVFVPTTPNPTSGFLLFFPKADIVELDMSIEDAAKLVISAGLVYPPTKKTSSKSTIEKGRTSKKA